ncbi:MAG TPA: RusA family crossover junction endodeoxyribonuclease [Alphaproteobacteria bacterium]|nr:RusA family crossover junction endodeoxyribonuclease [Alphaproteobacteria bacterium]
MQPLEFTVAGIPISVQSSSQSRQRWKIVVRNAAEAHWPLGTPLVVDEVAAVIIYFHVGDTDLDVDNIVKPILDSLENVVYVNDRLVSQVLVRKTERAGDLEIRNPSPELTDALERLADDFVYIRISDGPDHGEVPL